MKTVQYYTWEIIPTNTPVLIKKCSKCNCQTYFNCSDRFRLNSQKKSMDVWLIYNCKNCSTSYNLTILSRVNPNTLDRKLFQKFNDNDETLAWQYAFDLDILQKNKVEIDYSNVEYDIIRQHESLFAMSNTSSDLIQFEIRNSYSVSLKLNHVIKVCLDISNSQLESMLSTGILTLYPIGTALKHKAKDEMKIVIHCEKLKKLMNEIAEK